MCWQPAKNQNFMFGGLITKGNGGQNRGGQVKECKLCDTQERHHYEVGRRKFKPQGRQWLLFESCCLLSWIILTSQSSNPSGNANCTVYIVLKLEQKCVTGSSPKMSSSQGTHKIKRIEADIMMLFMTSNTSHMTQERDPASWSLNICQSLECLKGPLQFSFRCY